MQNVYFQDVDNQSNSTVCLRKRNLRPEKMDLILDVVKLLRDIIVACWYGLEESDDFR